MTITHASPLGGLRAREIPATKTVTAPIDPAAPFKHGLAPLAAARLGRPVGERVLLRTVMLSDFAVAGVAGAGDLVTELKADSRKAICHVVEALGPQVPDGHVVVGDYAVQISAAADVLDWQDKGCRYSLVNYRDIIWCVSPAEIAAHAAAVTAAAG